MLLLSSFFFRFIYKHSFNWSALYFPIFPSLCKDSTGNSVPNALRSQASVCLQAALGGLFILPHTLNSQLFFRITVLDHHDWDRSKTARVSRSDSYLTLFSHTGVTRDLHPHGSCSSACPIWGTGQNKSVEHFAENFEFQNSYHTALNQV